MRKLLIACSLLLSSAVFAAEVIEKPVVQIEIGQDNADKSTDRLSYYFGLVPVNSITRAQFHVTNIGAYPLRMQSARIAGQGYFARHSCSGYLNPGQRCYFTIEYAPRFEGFNYGYFQMMFDQNYEVWVDLQGQARY